MVLLKVADSGLQPVFTEHDHPDRKEKGGKYQRTGNDRPL